MVSLLFGMILLLGLFYFAFLYGEASLGLLGTAWIIFCVVSFGHLLVVKKRCNAKLEIPLSIVEKGQTCGVGITAENGSVIGAVAVKFQVLYRGTGTKKYEKIWLRGTLNGAGKSMCRYEICFAYPGSYEICLAKIRLYSIGRCFHLDCKVGSKTNVVVLPEIKAIPVSVGERVRNFYGDSDVYDDMRPGYDPSETYSVREFRDGDKLPGIHWKLSAKVGELMVKENSLPKACPVEVFLYGYSYGKADFLEQMAALCFSMMDAGCSFYAIWYSHAYQDVVRTRVDDEESFYEFLSVYMQDGEEADRIDMVDLYRDKYRGEKGLHTFVFRRNQILQNGSEIKNLFDREVMLN